jgi:dihydropteroate synthase
VTWDEGAALERVQAAVAEGADILDVGCVPAKPGPEVTVAEEIRRGPRLLARRHPDAAHPAVPAVFTDVMADVTDRVLGLAERARRAGVDPARIVIDPAHDFGKNTWHSLELTRRLGELTATGWPVLLSASRKDFVGETLGAPVEDRLAGTLAVTAVGAWLGARIFRAHDVRATRQALDMVAAVRGDLPPARAVRGLA